MDCCPSGSSVHGDSPVCVCGVCVCVCGVCVVCVCVCVCGVCVCVCVCVCVWLVAQSYPQARILLDWVSIFPNPRMEAGSPALQVASLPVELPGKPH